ncbi:hypothetical protein C8A00DRAFT_16641 [Chaetomidium leptoderma]|uniref:Aminoglycoside phosphotransferase domain-containing protein n=1 Tax=Chaetomidium leptoderma TaxID=669021 RepID=A0AAN6VIQ4_9PEZI|nr:hypothetical protein C8A00DRAFT_16641 [Chaetomidium leptoderma]
MSTTTAEEYSVEQEILDFFKQTSATRSECDTLAKELVRGTAVPFAVQGVCSYTVYGGPNEEFVVQFRLNSLGIKEEVARLARRIFGDLAPDVSAKGQIGQEGLGKKEPLLVYVMSRVRGISHLDFILAHSEPENSPEWFAWRKNLIMDVARFFALAWKSPQPTGQSSDTSLLREYQKDLELLFTTLPERFRPIIQKSLDSLPAIFNLPEVLLHKDFGSCNIMVDSTSCHLVGVIDWAEAEVGPFGTNLYSLEVLMGKFHFKKGWIRYEDYDTLEALFWGTMRTESVINEEQIQTAKWAAIVGMLRSWGSTSRLANMPEPVPIKDDESGAYNLLQLDGLLITPATKIV